MTLSKRDAHLKEFFSEDIFKQLDEAEKQVLYDEFANNDVRILATQPIENIHARLAVHLQAEFQRRLTHIQPEEYELLKPWYLENCHTVSELYCLKCGALLAIELDTIDDAMNPNHHQGKFIVPIGDKLMAYRPRLDGVMGFQCGNVIENKDAAEVWAEFEAEARKSAKAYGEELDAWEALSDKKKAATSPPVQPEFTTPDIAKFIECDNDTRWAKIEIDNIPEDHVMTSITKDDRIKVKQEMDAANYSPDVKETKNGIVVESFELRKVK